MEVRILKIAENIARVAHQDQYRKNGEPYISHVQKVVSFVEDSIEVQVGAWLHDVLEDSEFTSKDLSEKGIPIELVRVVESLSQKREQSYTEYIQSVSSSEIAVKVKKADLIANMTENPGNKQIVKFSKALIMLCK